LANRPHHTLLIRSTLVGGALVLGMGGAFLLGQRLRHVDQSPLTPIRLAQKTSNPLESLTAGRGSGGLGRGTNALPQDAHAGQDTFDTVYGLVKENYYSKLPTETKMSQGAVRAMVASLEDANSYFLDPQQYQLFRAEGRGQHAGIGAVLQVKSLPQDGYNDHKLVVVATLPGSPAEKAGLKSGDVIAQIEGRSILGYNPLITFTRVVKRFQDKDATEDELEQSRQTTLKRIRGGVGYFAAMMLLRGDKTEIKKLASISDAPAVPVPKSVEKLKNEAAKTEATKTEKEDETKRIANKDAYILTVERPGVKEPIKMTVKTGITEVPALIVKKLDNGETYIKIPYFTETTGDEFEKAVKEVPANSSLILDLRDNPGGFFDAAQRINGLLGGGKVLATEIGAKGRRVTLTSETPALPGHLRVAVLVNKGTAATAEALAASLMDAQAATLLGTPTFGDTQVVNLYALADGSAFTLTTGKLISPKERNWAGTGLTPTRALPTNITEAQILIEAQAAVK
jgi:carboxyl-terminal processing protease